MLFSGSGCCLPGRGGYHGQKAAEASLQGRGGGGGQGRHDGQEGEHHHPQGRVGRQQHEGGAHVIKRTTERRNIFNVNLLYLWDLYYYEFG